MILNGIVSLSSYNRL